MTSTRHRWGERVECGPYKSEKTCIRCDVTRASMHQHVGGAHDQHWKEFWRDGERVDDGSGATPPCDFRLERKLNAAGLETAAHPEVVS
jgi:hypothetical protein